MADLINELVWSHSRARLFNECKRAYWFGYYGSWGGWQRDATRECKNTWIQKKLTSIPMWTGTRVHGAAEWALARALEGTPVPGEAELVAATLAECRRDVRRSDDGSWLERPAKNVGFREHYYREPLEADAFTQAIAEVERQVRGLFANKVFQRLLAVPQRIVEVERLQRFPLADFEVWVSLDVLVQDGQGGGVVIDWKTGADHHDAEIAAQLGVYGLYIVRQLGFPADRVQAMHVNLRYDTVTKHQVGPTEMALAERTMVESMADMRAALESVPENRANMNDFPPLPVGSPACQHCNVRGVCGRA